MRAAGVGATRREVLLGGAAALAGTVAVPSVASAASGGDQALLMQALEAERLVVWVYERVLGTGLISPTLRAELVSILGHEREHVALLDGLLRLSGGARADGGLSLQAAREQLARHHVAADPRRLRTQHDCLKLLVDTESLIEAVWFRAVAHLQDPALAGTGARVMACEAQHWTVLSLRSQHGDPKRAVPYAFVRGSA